MQLEERQHYMSDKKGSDALERLEQLINTIASDLKETKSNLSKGFEKVEENFEAIHKKIDALSSNTEDSIKGVDLNIISLREEISKINDITQYESQYQNLTAIKGGK